MHSIIFSPQAKKDLQEIKEFIAKDNPTIALRVIESILFFSNNLSLFPLIGRESENKLGLRELIEPTFRYTIVYHFDGKNIGIVTIFKYKNNQ